MAVIFSKIKTKNAGIAVATASIFNAEIWKKNNISLSSLSGQSTSGMVKAKVLYQPHLPPDGG